MIRSAFPAAIAMLLTQVGVAQVNNPLFTLIPPPQSHVDFINPVVDAKDHNVLIYSNYYGGAGVGVGDFNRDGFQDLFFAGNLTGDRLYLNQGSQGTRLEFADVTTAAGITDNGGWSSGVVVADVNNDGWADIYVTRELYDNQPELRRNRLYLNRGALTAEGCPQFVESAARYGLDNSERTRHATFLDYDRDGDLDLFLLNQPPNPGNFSDLYGTKPSPENASRLYRNDVVTAATDFTGEPRFTDVTAAAGVQQPGYPNSVTASDLNNDGWTDLYVAHDFDAPDCFFLNNRDGTFTNVIDSALRHISYYSMGVDAADIDNDGWLDLMVLDMVAEDNFRLKANMSGMDPQAFRKVLDAGGHYQYMFNTLQRNVPRPEADAPYPLFSDIAQLSGVPSTDWSWSNLIADFDNDGHKDIHVTNGLLRDIRNTDADKAFSHYVDSVARTWVQNNPNGGDVSIWDILDLEEAMQIVPSEKLANYAFRNQGDLTFSKVTSDWGLDQRAFSHGSAYADLDNDGDLDLVVNNVNDTAFVYRNNSVEQGQHHYLHLVLTDTGQHRALAGTRVRIKAGDQEQWVELTGVRGMYSTSELAAHFGLGPATTIDALTIRWPDGSVTQRSKVAADQRLFIDRSASQKPIPLASRPEPWFAPVTTIDFRHQENEYDDFAKQVLLPHKLSRFGPALAVADVNGDGRDDCFVGGAADQAGQLFFQDAQGEWKPAAALSEDAQSEDVDAAFLDVDSDGDADLYVVSGGNAWPDQDEAYQDRLYLNDGQGNFSRAANRLPSLTESGSCVRPFDFDGDGDPDLLVGGRHRPGQYPAPTTTRLLRNQNGTFEDVTEALAPDLLNLGMVTDAVWTDVDQDQRTDLVLVGEWMPITLLRYDGTSFGEATERLGLDDTRGWWFSVESADVDNDGDLDLVAGNLGLNYKYHASPEAPFEVHYDDFDNSGTKDIVLSYYNFGEQFPLRGRSCSSQQVPLIGKKFATYERFAAANLVDVYGVENLQSALHYQATTFASTYLENRGDGSFVSHPLPNEAQVSSINDILVKDFDQDGHQDLLVAGNLYTSEVETPRNDAGMGLLLRGDGHGRFQPVAAQQSGILLPYDVKKLATATTSKRLLILSAVNNGPLRSFRRSDTSATGFLTAPNK
ncbi:MAG: VCBS repeat-containing protein [Tunicatimonas sp.]